MIKVPTTPTPTALQVAVKSRIYLHLLAEALVEGACFHRGSEIGYLLRAEEELHLTLEKDLGSSRASGAGINAGGGTERDHDGKIERTVVGGTMWKL